MIKAKYFKSNSITDDKPRPTDSSNWKGLIKSFNIAKDGLMWRIGNGQETSDQWIESGPILVHEGVQIDSNQIKLKVGNMID